MALSDKDRTLLDRCLNGAEGAWEDFLDRYLPLITHVVNTTLQVRLGDRLAGNHSQAREDVVAEVLLGLVDNDFLVFRRFRGQSSLGTYIVVVTRRIAIRSMDRLKRAAALPKSVIAESSTAATVAGRLDVESEMALENAEEVRSLLERLPASEAAAIRMFHLEHRSYEDIGLHIGIAENSVGPLLSRARERMRGLRS